MWCFLIADTVDLRFVTVNTSDCLFAVKAERANMDQPVLTPVSSAFDPEALKKCTFGTFSSGTLTLCLKSHTMYNLNSRI